MGTIIRTISSWRDWLLGFEQQWEQDRYLARWRRSYLRNTANQALRAQRQERLGVFAEHVKDVHIPGPD